MKYYLGPDLYFSVYNAKDLSNKITAENIHELDVFAISTVTGKSHFIIQELKDLNPDLVINIKSLLDDNVNRENYLANSYKTLGLDRLAKLCGALVLRPNNNIILFDFGTATTMTLAKPHSELYGDFVSGYITPGFKTSIRALDHYCHALDDYSSSDLLKHLETRRDDLRDTEAQIIYGCYQAHRGLVKQWLTQAEQALDKRDTISIATGGHAEIFGEFFDEVLDSSVLLNGFFDKDTQRQNSHTNKSHQA